MLIGTWSLSAILDMFFHNLVKKIMRKKENSKKMLKKPGDEILSSWSWILWVNNYFID